MVFGWLTNLALSIQPSIRDRVWWVATMKKEKIEKILDTASKLVKPSQIESIELRRTILSKLKPDPLNDRKTNQPGEVSDQVFVIIDSRTVRGNSTGKTYRSVYLTNGAIIPGAKVLGAVKDNIAYVAQQEEGIVFKDVVDNLFLPKPPLDSIVVTINIGFTGWVFSD